MSEGMETDRLNYKFWILTRKVAHQYGIQVADFKICFFLFILCPSGYPYRHEGLKDQNFELEYKAEISNLGNNLKNGVDTSM